MRIEIDLPCSNTRDYIALERCGHVVRTYYKVVKHFSGHYSRERLVKGQLRWLILRYKNTVQKNSAGFTN